MLSFLNKYGRSVHSQNLEDGIISECVDRLELAGWLGDVRDDEWSPGYCVEIGGNDGRWMSNTAHLIEQGWSGLFVESNFVLYLKCKDNWKDNPRVRCQCSRVDEKNINAFVDDKCDLLSIDTDGSDYEIFRGLKARPKIVIVEIDSSIEPPSERVNADGGVGYWTMTTLALESGYFLLVHTGNLVLVHQRYQHLFPECKPHPLLEWELYFNRAWVKEGV